ncbi:MAG: transposase [Desulforegulaceae bacterium]|nr:transposase [Desulforegulaceae bacterium]
MTRPLRIEYPGAWYHIMNRGRRGEDIFSDKRDYEVFINLLKETAEQWNVKITAYCLMSNHYHILLQTPEGNLSRSMRHLNGIYTQRYNKMHGYDGQLFRGRYKSILVDEETYLLQLLKYIHKNPLKAKLVENIDDYPWSSHNSYLSNKKDHDWLNKEFVFSRLHRDKRKWKNEYKKLMYEDNEDKITEIFESKKLPSFIGSENFVDWVKKKFYKPDEKKIIQTRSLAPSTKKIIQGVCNYFDIEEKEILISRRGMLNDQRNIAIYLVRKMRRETHLEISSYFRINSFSSVSSAINRLEKRIKTDVKLKNIVEEIKSQIINSQ